MLYACGLESHSTVRPGRGGDCELDEWLRAAALPALPALPRSRALLSQIHGAMGAMGFMGSMAPGEPERLTVPELQGFGQRFLRGANSIHSATH